MDLEKLLENVASYNITDNEKIRKAYQYAYNLHDGQFRQSGEPYIIHPLNVAYILSELHADSDTLCAGLLHDTLEDTNTSKKDIAHEFNPTIASLVDGVTKLSKMNYSSKQDLNMANTRKIILGLTEDVRIILIKLADRLHNMRTLEYKSEFKQKENSVETMEIFVPLAYYLGTYRIKQELEDRFGTLDEKLIIYMYEEWFEKMAKEKHVDEVRQTKNYVELYFNDKYSSKVDGEKLFEEAYKISNMFRFMFKDNRLIVVLDTLKLEKHYIYYLVELLKNVDFSSDKVDD